jgi:regulator of sigma E protease
MIQSIIAVVLVLGGLIFFHELGHFTVARLLGIGVKKFSLGFGPKLWGVKSGATEYRLSAVPLGGYVQLAGENPDDDLPAEFTPRMNFSLRPAWQRMIVVAAGPMFNFLLAVLLYWVIFLGHGMQEVLPMVGDVQPGSPAQLAGLRPGDTILSINGKDIRYWRDLAETIQKSGGQPLALHVRRDDAVQDYLVQPEVQSRKNIFGEEVNLPMIGIAAGTSTVTIELGVGEAGTEAFRQTWMIVRLTVQGLVKIVERVVPLESIGGPIMIAQMVSQQAAEGIYNVLALAAVISVNLGLINLLPIPVLDGGHIVFFGLEAILRRPLNERIQQLTVRMGIVFLLALMALAIYNDLSRYTRAPF